MQETYDVPGRPDEPCAIGSAHYSRFRRFQVQVEARTRLPK